METIVALATARGRAGVAVIRISGPLAFDVCETLARRVPEPRRASLLPLFNLDGEKIDDALVLCFEEGASFTGERVVEFQVHGSTAVVAHLVRTCVSIEGVRAAEPGEFTRRAFLAGRLNLTEVEALADLIDAETELQRKHAQAVLDGSATKLIEAWRDDLLQALAMIEASLDFTDEELPDDMLPMVKDPLDRVHDSMSAQLQGRQVAEAVRDGFEVAIVGAVNVGKSSLLNALAGREAAITSEIEGTTRDTIEVRMDLDGLPVTILDTAGLRDTSDTIEATGISRGIDRAKNADLRVFLRIAEEQVPDFIGEDDLVLFSRVDETGLEGISSKTGAGIAKMIDRVSNSLQNRVSGSSVFSRERHFAKLASGHGHLSLALGILFGSTENWEVVSEEIRLALRDLDGIIGRIDVEDVLGRIFSSFCIGK